MQCVKPTRYSFFTPWWKFHHSYSHSGFLCTKAVSTCELSHELFNFVHSNAQKLLEIIQWSPNKHLMTTAEIVQSWQILLSPRHLGHRKLSVKCLTMKSACLNVILFIQQEYKHYFLTTVDVATFSLTKKQSTKQNDKSVRWKVNTESYLFPAAHSRFN